jgi:hypothetical protein
MFNLRSSRASTVATNSRTKKDFKEERLTGYYRSYDPETGEIKEEGQFQYGEETGLWK